MEQVTSDMADVSVKDGKISFGDLPDEIIVRIAKDAFVNPFVDDDFLKLKSKVDKAKSWVKKSKKELEETTGSKMTARTKVNLARNAERTAESDFRRKEVALHRNFNENKHQLMLMKRLQRNFYDNPENYFVKKK